MDKSYRHNAGFGKRIEFLVISRMLEQGLDVYIPLVDDFGIDAVIRRKDGTFIEIQIKARSKDVSFGDAALFAAIPHEKPRDNYYFVFYSHHLDTTWVLSSDEFIKEANRNKTGKNEGKYSIRFNGKNTKNQTPHANLKFEKYVCSDFERFK